MSQASCSWTPDMVNCLLKVYGEIIQNTGKAADNGSLTKQQWSKVVNEFNREAKTSLVKQQIHSKINEQKKYFQQVNVLVDKSGFGLENGKVTASDEAWDELIANRPEIFSSLVY